MSTSPIPSDLMKYHPCPRTPLKVSGDLWSRVQGEPLIDSSYRKVQVLTFPIQSTIL